MRVGMWATKQAKYMPLFLYQLREAGIPFDVSENVTWEAPNAWAGRMRWFHDYAKKQRGTILLVDPWDQLFFGTAAELEEKVNRYNDEIVWSGERVCWPDPRRGDGFWDCGTPYKYPNCGAMVGDAALIAHVFNPKRIPNFGELNHEPSRTFHPDGFQTWIDQVYVQDLYLDGVGVIDCTCSMFQTLTDHTRHDFEKEGNRIKNTITGEYPLFFHATGRGAFPQMFMDLAEETLNG